MKPPKLTIERLRECLEYIPDEGRFIYKIKLNRKTVVGSDAGWVGFTGKNGYKRPTHQIGIDKHKYYCHRLAWFYMTGEWPSEEIDHIDGNTLNNTWANLRKASRQENSYNRQRDKNCIRKYPKWVRPNGKGFSASVKLLGKHKYLGTYSTPEEAHEVAKEFAQKLHGDFYAPV